MTYIEAERYHLESASFQVDHLRELAALKVSRAIHERGWTQTQAAHYLRVQQPRISDLMRGKTHKFTLDTLIEWLFALDRPVSLSDESPGFLVRPSDADSQRTVEHYTRVLLEDPRNTTALSRRANAYLCLKRYDLAIGDYTRQMELEPEQFGALANRVVAFRAAGQYRAALQDCETLAERFPDYNVYQNRGLVLESMGRLEEALQDHVRASQLEPHRPGPHTNRAGLLERLGRFEEAIEAYEAGLAADHTMTWAREAVERLRARLAG